MQRLRAQKSKVLNSLLDGFQNKPLLLRLVDNCLNFGTFPEIVLGRMGDNIKTELLSTILSQSYRRTA